jgi:regulator of RNase E activity RraA
MEARATALDVAERPFLGALCNLSTPLVGDCLDRLSGVFGLRPFHRSRKLIGTARTVKTRPGDNLFVYRALHALRPGEVLVVDAGGALDNAIVGELIQLYAASQGCSGFVIDGAIRDWEAFASADFPCYARGTSLRGPYKSGPGQLDVPVSIGGQVVAPGDVVFGDLDGVVSFSEADAPRIVAAAEARARVEDDVRRKIAAGDDSWLQPFLAAPATPGAAQ